MGRKSKVITSAADTDWGTPGGRVRWLLHHVFEGNRLAMSEQVGVSHTVLHKVAARKQEPGRRLLAAIAKHPKVNPAWLLTGQGVPLLQPADDAGRVIAAPVATQILPGSPQQYAELLSGDFIEFRSTLSQYWLRLGRDQPIIGDPASGFLLGDCLLMESDTTLFPPKERLFDRLCVVRRPGGDAPLKLAVASYDEPSEDTAEGIRIDTFDLGPTKSNLVKEFVFRRYPGGEIKAFEKEYQLVRHRGVARAVPIGDMEVEPRPPTIQYADIVAVWTEILRRPRSSLLSVL